jgi:hypothetical protein
MGCDYYFKEIIKVEYEKGKIIDLDFAPTRRGYLFEENYDEEKLIKNYGKKIIFTDGEWKNNSYKEEILNRLFDKKFIHISSHIIVWKRI